MWMFLVIVTQSYTNVDLGVEGLKLDLEHDMMPYNPGQLIAVAEKEFAWCEAEWKKVAHDMGLGDDWKAALEKAKHDYVAPGDQPALVARQAYEAVDFITKRDLITVPPLAIDDWLMTMMSPERQKTNPFFLGGDRIILSYPTDTMALPTSSTASGRTTRISATQPFSTSSSPATICKAGMRSATTRTASSTTRRSTSRAGRCGGSSTCGTSVTTRRPKTAPARSSGGRTAARASSSR